MASLLCSNDGTNPPASFLAVLLKNNQSADRARCPMNKTELMALTPIEAPNVTTTFINSTSFGNKINNSFSSSKVGNKGSSDASTMTNDNEKYYVRPFPSCTLPRLDLDDKLRPTVEWYPQSPASTSTTSTTSTTSASTPLPVPARWCALIRDCANIYRPLRRRVVSMTHEQWSDDYQVSQGNVTLTRAAHDRLGVNKVILQSGQKSFKLVAEYLAALMNFLFLLAT